MGAVKNHFHMFLHQDELETEVRRRCSIILLHALEDFRPEDPAVIYSRRWLVEATELWNFIDDLHNPEPFWDIMMKVIPEAFMDATDANSILFTNPENETTKR